MFGQNQDITGLEKKLKSVGFDKIKQRTETTEDMRNFPKKVLSKLPYFPVE